MTGLVIVPPAPVQARIECLLGETFVLAPPMWIVTTPDGREVTARDSEHAARVFVALSADGLTSDPMPEEN